ncbi:MAG: 50S ribosomal protein L22 [Phycisphaerales bacterium]|nr:MAG: 50S ribosomal protein L22 [Phycisphaerales bacterium]
MSGRDHPRCKASDVARLAQACGVAPRDLVRFESKINHHRGSTQKARLVVDLVRGKPVDQALNLLEFSSKRAAVNVKKALLAAIADAENADADVTRLVVTEVRVDEGPQIKRFQPKDRGRAHAIIKQTSHITVGVEERS